MSPLRIIRWKFVLPVGIFLAALVLFFVMFFDPLLERGLEKVGSKMNGALVEIDGLHTKFMAGRLEIKRIQVANREQPMENVFEAGPLVFQLNPSELISKRVIINEGSANGLAFSTPRKYSGALPRIEKKLEKQEKSQPSAASKLAEKYKERFKLNLDGIKSEAKERIKFDPKDLEVTKQGDALKDKATALPDEWKKRAGTLNVDGRLKDIEARIQSLKNTPTKGTEAIQAIPEAFKKLESVKSDLNTLKNDVSSAKTQLDTDVKGVQTGLTDLSKAKKKDVDNLMSRFNLDFADPQRLIEGMIGPSVVSRFQTIMKYVEMARAHMPSKAEEESIKPQARFDGMDVKFPTPAAPPRFWLMKAALSGVFQNVAASGSMADLTSDPSRIGKPFKLNLAGATGPQKYALAAVLDHTRDVSADRIDVHADGLDVKGFLKGSPLGNALTKGNGSAEVGMDLVGVKQIAGKINLDLGGLLFDDASLLSQVGLPASGFSKEDALKADFVKSIARAIEKTPRVNILANVSGTWEDPDLSISSNLTSVLGNVIKDSVGNAVKEQRQKLEADLDAVVKTKTDDVNKKLSDFQGKANAVTADYQQKIQKQIADATGLKLGGDSSSPIPGLKLPKLDGLFKKK